MFDWFFGGYRKENQRLRDENKSLKLMMLTKQERVIGLELGMKKIKEELVASLRERRDLEIKLIKLRGQLHRQKAQIRDKREVRRHGGVN